MKLREGTQRNLTDFFSGSVGAGAGGAGRKGVQSSRMHNALTSLRKGQNKDGDISQEQQARPKTTARANKKRSGDHDGPRDQGTMAPPKKPRKRKAVPAAEQILVDEDE